MTTTVKKGTLRPVAEIQGRKAAQRTPLVKPVEVPLSERTAVELRALARDLGLSSATRLTKKAELIAAIERARPATAPKEPRKLGSLAQEAAKAPDTGWRKAEEFSALVATHGWAAKTTKAGASVKVVAKRGTEVLTVAWTSGCYDYEASSYARGDRSRKVLNVSAARQIAARPGLEVVQ